jgi:curved DNA-binding protein CbpA
MRTTASGASGAGESTVTMYTGNAEKAKDFFNYSLEVLGLRNSNAALTEDILKTAYKKAAAKAHPDKGGSPQKFKEVTKAHAYLMEVLTKIGGRAVTTGTVSTDRETYIRQEEDNKWANMQPVKLDPKNLNMSAFNDMFEKTRMAEPDEDGYGSWLRDGADDSNKITNNTSQSPRDLLAARERDRVSVAQVTRSGRGDGFNRDAFMRDFDDSLKSDSRYQSGALILNPNTMAIVAPVGTELGRDRPADFTAPFMSDVNYTDLRSAYGHHSTITNHVQNVQVNDRSYDSYKSSYESGPAALSAEELALMRRAEAEVEDREKARQMRHISQDQAHMDNAERIRRLVITNK